jgi:hypothetical protein
MLLPPRDRPRLPVRPHPASSVATPHTEICTTPTGRTIVRAFFWFVFGALPGAASHGLVRRTASSSTRFHISKVPLGIPSAGLGETGS